MVKKRFALVRESDGFVVNVCVWDGVTEWNHLPPGITDIECPGEVGPGWSYIDGEWIAPAPPPVEPPSEE